MKNSELISLKNNVGNKIEIVGDLTDDMTAHMVDPSTYLPESLYLNIADAQIVVYFTKKIPAGRVVVTGKVIKVVSKSKKPDIEPFIEYQILADSVEVN